jgi:hypothetical protein
MTTDSDKDVDSLISAERDGSAQALDHGAWNALADKGRIGDLWTRYSGTDLSSAEAARRMAQTIVDAVSRDGERYNVALRGIDTAQTDIERKTITISAKPLDAGLSPDDLATVLSGFALHEVAHLRYGMDTAKATRRVFKYSRTAAMLSNVLDDVRIERRLLADYPGYAGVFKRVCEYLYPHRDQVPSDPISIATAAIRYDEFTDWTGVDPAERDFWIAWRDEYAQHDSPKQHVIGIRKALQHLVEQQRESEQRKAEAQKQGEQGKAEQGEPEDQQQTASLNKPSEDEQDSGTDSADDTDESEDSDSQGSSSAQGDSEDSEDASEDSDSDSEDQSEGSDSGTAQQGGTGASSADASEMSDSDLAAQADEIDTNAQAECSDLGLDHAEYEREATEAYKVPTVQVLNPDRDKSHRGERDWEPRTNASLRAAIRAMFLQQRSPHGGTARIQKRGRVDSRGLYRIADNDPRVFKRSTADSPKRRLVWVLVDNSGSMYYGETYDGSGEAEARTCADIAYEIAMGSRGLDAIRMSVFSWTTAMGGNGTVTPKRATDTCSIGNVWNTGDNPRDIYRIGNMPSSGTPTGAVLRHAGREIRKAKRAEETATIIMLTDGDADDPDSMIQAVETVRKTGVDVRAVALGPNVRGHIMTRAFGAPGKGWIEYQGSIAAMAMPIARLVIGE